MPRATASGETHPDGCWCGECKAVESYPGTEAPLDAGAGGVTPAVPSQEGLKKSRYANNKGSAIQRGHGKGTGMDRSFRARVTQWLAIRALQPDITHAEIAAKIGISPETLRHHITKAGKQGLLSNLDPIEQLKYQIIPKVVDNLNEFIDQKDKQVTLETAKHTIFKAYQASEGIQDQNNMVLALKIEAADPTQPKNITGEIIGTARSLDSAGSIIDVDGQ